MRISNEIVDSFCAKRNVVRLSDYIPNVKMNFHCNICNHDFKTTFLTFKSSKIGCSKCADTTLNVEKINTRFIPYNFVIIGVYKKYDETTDFKCLKCNCEFKSSVKKITKNPKCDNCNLINNTKSTNGKRFNNEYVDNFFKVNNILIQRIDNYITNNKSINFKCLKCDYVWKTCPSQFLNRNGGCPKCNGTAKLTNEIFDEVIKNKPIIRLGEYINGRSKIEMMCKKCNHIWKTIARGITSKKSDYGCPECNKPRHNEKKVIEFLKNNNIKYSFDICLSKIIPNDRKFRIDFYLPDYNLIIEYNGAQHYKATGHFSKCSEEEAKIKLKKQKERDEYVNNLCVNGGVEILWIDGRKYYNNSLINYLNNELGPKLVIVGQI